MTQKAPRGMFTHGTWWAVYKVKCPCDICLAYKHEFNAARRARRNGNDIPKRFISPPNAAIVHGTRAGYLKETRRNEPHCQACTEANTIYSRRKNVGLS